MNFTIIGSIHTIETIMVTQLENYQFVVCVKNDEYPVSLELHKLYRVIPDQEAAADGDLRIVDESGEDYLYPANWFVPIDVPRAVEQSLLRAA